MVNNKVFEFTIEDFKKAFKQLEDDGKIKSYDMLVTPNMREALDIAADEYIRNLNTEANYEDEGYGSCDVDGCKLEGCSGGIAWRETGYWTVCYKHSNDFREGKKQPAMKSSAVKRELNK